jgi:hypothetical protein
MSVGSEAAHYVGGRNCNQLSSSGSEAASRHFNRQADALLIHERATITSPRALPPGVSQLRLLLLLLPGGGHP